MEDLKKLLLAFLSKALNLDEKGVASLVFTDDAGSELKPEALDNIQQKHSEVVTKLKGDTKSAKDEAYGRGKKETMTAFEKLLADTFEFDNDEKLQGLDLVQAVVKKVTEAAGGKTVTDAEIKSHALYIALQKEMKKAVKDAEEKTTSEVDKVKAEWSREKTNSTVIKKALEIINGRKPIALSTDAEKAKVQRARQDKLLLAELMENDFRIDGEGDNATIVILKKDGTVLENEAGHAIDFIAFVNDKSETVYDFEASESREAPPGGKKPPAGGGAGKRKVTKPTSYQDFAKQYEDIEKDKVLTEDEKFTLLGELTNLNKGVTA